MSHSICSLYSNSIRAQSIPTLGRHHKVFSKGWRITRETQRTIQQQQQQQSLSPKICGQVWVLDRLDWVIHMNSFLHSIKSEVMLSSTSLIDMSFSFSFSFLVSYINIIFGLPLLSFVPSTWINSLLTSSLLSLLWTWPNWNHLKRLFLIFLSIGTTPILKQIQFQFIDSHHWWTLHLWIAIDYSLEDKLGMQMNYSQINTW